jgi:hypothetical protein
MADEIKTKIEGNAACAEENMPRDIIEMKDFALGRQTAVM